MGEQAQRAGVETLIVIDTDIFIDHFRGIQSATEYLCNIPIIQRATTDINLMELMRGAANRKECNLLENFLNGNGFIRLPVTATASRIAVELFRHYSYSHGLRIPEALVAGVVLELGLTLVTRNVKHFRFIPELKAIEPEYVRLLGVD